MSNSDMQKVIIRSLLKEKTRVDIIYRNGRKPQHVRLVQLSDFDELLNKGMFRVALFSDIDAWDATHNIYFTRIFSLPAIHSIHETNFD